MEGKKGRIFVISAPSGAGKTSIMRPFLKRHPEYVFSVSATTRKRRPGEKDGVDYFYISEEEFQRKIDKKEFLEWERVYDYYYGTLRNFVENTVADGKDIFIEVEVKGALSIKRQYPDALLIFIDPPSFDELRKRLMKRKTENEEEMAKRLERAKMELEQKVFFDVAIVNNDIEEATRNLELCINQIKG
jgi:guanylate kinase